MMLVWVWHILPPAIFNPIKETSMKKLLLVLVSALAFSISAWAAVDLNKASQAELETVKGIGPAKAKAIIDYRKKNGNFKSVDELDKVPGFGKKTVDSVKKEITVGNATATAAGKPAKAAKDAKATTPATPAVPAAKDKPAKK
jgi:competence protein ComEA